MSDNEEINMFNASMEEIAYAMRKSILNDHSELARKLIGKYKPAKGEDLKDMNSKVIGALRDEISITAIKLKLSRVDFIIYLFFLEDDLRCSGS